MYGIYVFLYEIFYMSLIFLFRIMNGALFFKIFYWTRFFLYFKVYEYWRNRFLSHFFESLYIWAREKGYSYRIHNEHRNPKTKSQSRINHNFKITFQIYNRFFYEFFKSQLSRTEQKHKILCIIISIKKMLIHLTFG